MRIVIPWRAGNLGAGYNYAMGDCSDEWVLFLDGDVLMMTQGWYGRLEAWTETEDAQRVGWLSAVTNDCYCTAQMASTHWRTPPPASMDMAEHARYADGLRDVGIRDITTGSVNAPGQPLRSAFSGFSILTQRRAWRAVGGFCEHKGMVGHLIGAVPIQFAVDGVLGVDNDYCLKLREGGWRTVVLPGVYCWHGRAVV